MGIFIIGARGRNQTKFRKRNFLKPCGSNPSTTGKLPFSRPLSRSSPQIKILTE